MATPLAFESNTMEQKELLCPATAAECTLAAKLNAIAHHPLQLAVLRSKPEAVAKVKRMGTCAHPEKEHTAAQKKQTHSDTSFEKTPQLLSWHRFCANFLCSAAAFKLNANHGISNNCICASGCQLFCHDNPPASNPQHPRRQFLLLQLFENSCFAASNSIDFASHPLLRVAVAPK